MLFVGEALTSIFVCLVGEWGHLMCPRDLVASFDEICVDGRDWSYA